MAIFSKNDIQYDIDSGSYNRGQQYFKAGKVVEYQIELETSRALQISSKVNGYYLYMQQIRVIKNQFKIDVDGDCSCPVAFNCKHVAAVLLDYLSDENQSFSNRLLGESTKPLKPKEKVERWFKQLESIQAPILDTQTSGSDQWLAYIFKYDETFNTIEISFARTGFKKKGGYYKPQKISFETLRNSAHNYYSPAYLNDDDKLITMWLASQLGRFYSYAPVRLTGTIGKQVLDNILASQRCFWEEISEENRLYNGDNLEMSYRWEKLSKAKKESCQLTSNLSIHQKLIKTEPPSYIDIENKRIGYLKTPLTTHYIELFNEMPPVPGNMLEKISLKIVLNRMENTIPLPAPIEIVCLNGEQLKPKLLLTKAQANGVFSRQIPEIRCLKLLWLYGEFEVASIEDCLLIKQKNDQHIKISRDTKIEQTYIDFLLSLNFEPVNKHYDEIASKAADIFAPNPLLTEQQQLIQWKQFFEIDLPELKKSGWAVEFDSDFHLDFIQADDTWDMEVVEENDWFSLKFDLTLPSGEKLPLIPLVSPLLKDYNINDIPEEILVETNPGQYLSLAREKILPIIKLLYELFEALPQTLETIEVSKFDVLQVEHLSQQIELKWLGGNKLKKLAQKLASFKGLKTVLPSKKFNGQLRDYQQQGLNWLQFLRDFEFSGLLADDMGLGKTVQTLAHIQKEKMARRMKEPCLIIAPTSLMGNWRREASEFTPNLTTLVLQGSDRRQNFEKIDQHDLILTTYPLIVRDFEVLSKLKFYYIILDEAQNIKNPKAKASQLIKSLQSEHRLALTGTPMENHLGEMWSIFDFLMPGFLASETSFKKKYRTPIEKHGDSELSNMLARRVKPFLLRRTKERVAKELPPKTTFIRTAVFSKSQSALYEAIRLSMEKKIMQVLASKGLNRSHITILDALLKLRQICCHPQLLKLPQAKKVEDSAKLELLMSMVPSLVEEGRKILIFSQFTSMLKIIEAQIQAKNIDYVKLTGSTKNRDKVIEEFTDGNVPVFLISLKAGGVGLNLTQADTVIHYDPWWNPAVENQASDRAHRIGQDRPVFVYKLVVENTLEEKILEMQKRKQALADGVYGNKVNKNQNALTAKDIEELLAPSGFENHKM